MKRKITVVPILLLILCLSLAAEAGTVRMPWPTHAPDATPYVRVFEESDAPVPEEPTHYDSPEEAMRALYEELGHFYFHDWELALFRSLPQNEPASFVPHSWGFSLDAEEALRLAELFAAEDGVESEVIAMHQIVSGQDDWGYLPVVTLTPARLFELSDVIEEPIFLEQLYPQVRERFDVKYWPGPEEVQS